MTSDIPTKVEPPEITEALVRRLVATQFPQWADLVVTKVAVGGWDNKTFHLGKHMVVRLPSTAEYAVQVEKEIYWLPKLASLLPLAIPSPLAAGEPTKDYPWRWYVYQWLEGETAADGRIGDLREFAVSLAHFLDTLEGIDATDGPLPGPHNFYRGGALTTYDNETRRAITALAERIDVGVATRVWETALASTWRKPPVWIHGDISAGNLLVDRGRLSAVIDFGMLGIGDPACDLVIAWTLLEGEGREMFRAALPLDRGTWARGRGWALWKALIIAAGLSETNAIEAANSWGVIWECLAWGDA